MTLPPRRVGIVGNREKKGARALIPALARWMREREVQVLLEKGIAGAVRGLGSGVPLGSLISRVDAVLVLGGDGTFLSAAREAARADVPILGVNLGGLGFLTETAESDLYPALERLLQGDVEIEPRMMVEARVRSRKSKAPWIESGLNDVVIHQSDESRMVQLDLRIGSTSIGTLAADGLIVATPTGSTAYSLSAGGPIIRPTIEGLLATPICPHSLAFRPLLISAGEKLRVRVGHNVKRARITLDGQVSRLLQPGDDVEIRRAKGRVSMISLRRESFYEVLREKLAWAGPSTRTRIRD
ncbi:MAG: NAD(+)/NADH kinase [Candidatus Eisenbacteria bacterium]|uniref:NAD kinase n=1 Tax=Eiseniibacteriota bacterium TaxID=2212470 RepID=A0A538SGA3_UNCEI|nr:MAG: NAD(+)/NADH kinase [Candidatus Eisenbacteria bacterium]